MNGKIYVNKYDYLNYYTKQPAFWFLPNSVIESTIKAEIHRYKKLGQYNDDIDEQDLEECEIDAYEFYRNEINDNKDIDLNNPKIQEGIILDRESRNFIINEYEFIKVKIDLDEQFYDKRFDNEFLANKTKELLLNNDRIILFQPVFIFENLITKCDAIIKYKGQIILIETKGTTTAKLHHGLDIYFQAQVLQNIDYLQDVEIYYKLCLIEYNLLNQGEVSFILTDYFNYSKVVTYPERLKTMSKKQAILYKQKIKLGEGLVNVDGEFEAHPISLLSIVNNSLEDFQAKLSVSKHHKSRISIEKTIELFETVYKNFKKIVNEIYERKLNFLINIKPILKEKYLIDNIQPHYNDKGDIKVNDNWLILRKLYQLMGYKIFNYSGRIVKQTGLAIHKIDKDCNILNYCLPDYDRFLKYEFIIDCENVKFLLNSLKDKKVYFDFETINTSIRPIDNCLPFMQIVTQCSIIIDDNSKDIRDVKCDNLIFDPINLSVNNFKEVVDKLYMGSDYSYVVYNKSFEASRLKEMAEFINEQEYTTKINIIINNLFDLADFFNINSTKKPISIFIHELGGFYSIKKVLPLVEKYKKDIYEVTGCKDYNQLEIGNGLIAQNETMLRFLDQNYGNDKWQELAKNLQIYCENDVRAMIAVEYFVKWIYEKVSKVATGNFYSIERERKP